MSRDSFGSSSLREKEEVNDVENDDGLDVDDLFDAIGDRDWATVKRLLDESGHAITDLGEIVESVMEDDED
jgi:hypothetical protein